MRRIENIEREIQEFSPRELAAFRKWFSEFDANAWDRQIEEDVKAGKLDEFANVAEEAYKSGRYRLENDPRFLQRIEKARGSLRAGKGVKLEGV